VGIHRLLHSSCSFLNTNTAISRQLIRTARTLEAEWLASLQGSVGTETQEVVKYRARWAAGFDHVTAHSRLARVLKLTNRLFL
jgi:predicted secreted Zn-dependent protease